MDTHLIPEEIPGAAQVPALEAESWFKFTGEGHRGSEEPAGADPHHGTVAER